MESRDPFDLCAPPRTRRRFARDLFGAAGALGLGGLAGMLRSSPALAQALDVPRYLCDIDGDGELSATDAAIIRATLGAERGTGLRPLPGYDYRADLEARGRVDSREIDVFRELRAEVRRRGLPPRPITVSWHYGWYHRRKRNRQTASFLGGNYLSRDRQPEELFNDLKTEFGISVDALSWISPRANPRNRHNLSRGYLRARNLDSRHVAMLYESGISLGDPGKRLDFLSTDVRGGLVEDFADMGNFLKRVERRGGNLLTLDQRPVVFLYASHTWIRNASREQEYLAFEAALELAIERFRRAYGRRPFLVGEEMPLAPGDQFGADRRRRSTSFDGIFVYHHAASPDNIIAGGPKLGTGYALAQRDLFLRTLWQVRDVRNRFTDEPLLIVPSLAAGFAKQGFRKLIVNRISYANYLSTMMDAVQRFYFDAHLAPAFVSAPLVTVGSWNEEFEGHALFPFAENQAVNRVRHDGFDLVMALKETFGWNHYAARPIIGTPMR